VHTGFWWGDLRKGDHLVDLGIYEEVLLKWIFEKLGLGSMNWTDVAQGRAGGGLL
jgi:hypothetical protein